MAPSLQPEQRIEVVVASCAYEAYAPEAATTNIPHGKVLRGNARQPRDGFQLQIALLRLSIKLLGQIGVSFRLDVEELVQERIFLLFFWRHIQ